MQWQLYIKLIKIFTSHFQINFQKLKVVGKKDYLLQQPQSFSLDIT